MNVIIRFLSTSLRLQNFFTFTHLHTSEACGKLTQVRPRFVFTRVVLYLSVRTKSGRTWVSLCRVNRVLGRNSHDREVTSIDIILCRMSLLILFVISTSSISVDQVNFSQATSRYKFRKLLHE